MCTVTYIPVKDAIYLTSNRDEKNWRTPAIAPAVYEFTSGRILFPKDGDAGGTWIALHANGNAVIFLNGGFISHVPTPPYRKSRGLILLDLIDHTTPFNGFSAINLNNIEPFTAIIRDNGHLFECRWDGKQKYNRVLDPVKPEIWSSATLYDKTVADKRRNWFNDWITENPEPTMEDILHFHQFTGDGDLHNDLMMNREGKVFTVSITSICISPDKLIMDYVDVKKNERVSKDIFAEPSTAAI